MSDPVVASLSPQDVYDRKVRLARTVVIRLAWAVGFSLVVAFVFAAYNLVTDRPAKEMFLGPSE